MTAAARFRLAPVAGGVVDWPRAVDVVLAPRKLSMPVRVRLGDQPRGGGS